MQPMNPSDMFGTRLHGLSDAIMISLDFALVGPNFCQKFDVTHVNNFDVAMFRFYSQIIATIP